ncbi:MAG: hypothetical protein SP1CHLAM54_00350 [Chlamydiia bacterium]|nr:hypothetical protein [Chlamydiia bacterium]MCH9614957.1 hypothetical protein [Chlamydiia bacterium]MCH9629993.1 hypothetical protein [Chlamydiia bacterium]
MADILRAGAEVGLGVGASVLGYGWEAAKNVSKYAISSVFGQKSPPPSESSRQDFFERVDDILLQVEDNVASYINHAPESPVSTPRESSVSSPQALSMMAKVGLASNFICSRTSKKTMIMVAALVVLVAAGLLTALTRGAMHIHQPLGDALVAGSLAGMVGGGFWIGKKVFDFAKDGHSHFPGV